MHKALLNNENIQEEKDLACKRFCKTMAIFHPMMVKSNKFNFLFFEMEDCLLLKKGFTRLCITCGNLNEHSFYCEECETRDWPVDDKSKKGKKLKISKSSLESVDLPDIIGKAALNKFKDVEKLLSAKADAMVTSRDGLTPLSIAIELGHRDVVSSLIAKAPQDVLYMMTEDQTSLQKACLRGQTSIVHLLLKAGGQRLLDMSDIRGLSSLYYACEGGNVEIIRALLRQGGPDLLLRCGRKDGAPPLRNSLLMGFPDPVPPPARPRQLSASAIHVSYPRQLSASVIRVSYPRQLSASAIRVSSPRQLSASAIRVSYPRQLSASAIATTQSRPTSAPPRRPLRRAPRAGAAPRRPRRSSRLPRRDTRRPPPGERGLGGVPRGRQLGARPYFAHLTSRFDHSL